jgi:hypothetical protein
MVIYEEGNNPLTPSFHAAESFLRRSQFSSSEEIPHILLSAKGHHCYQNDTQHIPLPSYINLFNTPLPHLRHVLSYSPTSFLYDLQPKPSLFTVSHCMILQIQRTTLRILFLFLETGYLVKAITW